MKGSRPFQTCHTQNRTRLFRCQMRDHVWFSQFPLNYELANHKSGTYPAWVHKKFLDLLTGKIGSPGTWYFLSAPSLYHLPTVLMRILRRLILWVSCASAAALPSSWPRDDGGQAQQQPVPVTGMTTGLDSGTSERPARWEVNVLQDEGGPRW